MEQSPQQVTDIEAETGSRVEDTGHRHILEKAPPAHRRSDEIPMEMAAAAVGYRPVEAPGVAEADMLLSAATARESVVQAGCMDSAERRQEQQIS
jgi:hypothetical protein